MFRLTEAMKTTLCTINLPKQTLYVLCVCVCVCVERERDLRSITEAISVMHVKF